MAAATKTRRKKKVTKKPTVKRRTLKTVIGDKTIKGDMPALDKEWTEKTPTKSKVIREIIANNPDATVGFIQEALTDKGIKCSVALINKIKYGRAPAKGKKAGTKSKATQIRDAIAELGVDSRPRDVIAHLAQQGVTVTSAQVSTLKNKPINGNGNGTSLPEGMEVSLAHLLAARQLVRTVGSHDLATYALKGLAHLLN